MSAFSKGAVGLMIAMLRYIAGLETTLRRSLLVALDFMIIFAAVWLAFWLRLDEWQPVSRPIIIVYLIALAAWIAVATAFSTYRNIVRFSGSRSIFELLTAVGAHMVIVGIALVALEIIGVPRTVAVIHALIMAILMVSARIGIRVLLRDILEVGPKEDTPQSLAAREADNHNVLIYGAGLTGRQLLQSMKEKRAFRVCGFIDDNPQLANRRLDGIKVYSPRVLPDVIKTKEIDEIILAIPSETRARRREIVNGLQTLGVQVRTLPDLHEIMRGKLSVNDIHEVNIGDLLGRQAVAADRALLAATVHGRTVMVTGAGGSIGSELARQLLPLMPSKLVLVDMSEFALFQIDSELRAEAERMGDRRVILIAELGTCADQAAIARVMEKHRPHTVFHAAAYKHVPLVESNPIAGAANNILATKYTTLAAEAAGVERFILVSTDKAVRPPNVMGATKRVCELILQGLHGRGSKTIFAMVRFGNVLGSSGSVVPLFKQQIEKGGPITVTSSAMTRYFMTIPEAAQLVIQAGAMARGGEVFLLDMGQPVRIMKLAETMIRLSGLSIRNKANPSGDIEIVEIGLRPGEKLFEELLIDSDSLPTGHPSIFQGQEPLLAWDDLSRELDAIDLAFRMGNAGLILETLRRLVPGYGNGSPHALGTGEAQPGAANRRLH
jgi:FlaA1/EpsC-like NDP-sugar epimerase